MEGSYILGRKLNLNVEKLDIIKGRNLKNVSK